ncbi:hypothetical protein ACX9R5_18375 [Rathayibacter sp. CAU 1779]
MTTIPLFTRPIRLDPIGATAAWTFAPFLGAIAVGYAVMQTVMHNDEIVHPDLAIVAVYILAGAAIALTVASHPNVARLDAVPAVFVIGAAVLAAVLAAFASWGHNKMVQDDWGQIGVGLMVLGLLWLRPPRDIILLGGVSALALGVLAFEEGRFLRIANAPFVYAVVAATPVVVLTAVAAASGHVLNRFSSEWMIAARRGLKALEPELRVLEQDVLHRAQLDELRQVTLPLLSSIVQRGEITRFDIEAAIAVSAQLRERALEQVHVTWVDGLVREAGMHPGAVYDPEQLLTRVPPRERATITACLVELTRLGALDPAGSRLVVQRAPTADSSERVRFEVAAPLAADWRFLRRTARPFVSVLRSLTGDATITRNGTTMILRFGFAAA